MRRHAPKQITSWVRSGPLLFHILNSFPELPLSSIDSLLREHVCRPSAYHKSEDMIVEDSSYVLYETHNRLRPAWWTSCVLFRNLDHLFNAVGIIFVRFQSPGMISMKYFDNEFEVKISAHIGCSPRRLRVWNPISRIALPKWHHDTLMASLKPLQTFSCSLHKAHTLIDARAASPHARSTLTSLYIWNLTHRAILPWIFPFASVSSAIASWPFV